MISRITMYKIFLKGHLKGQILLEAIIWVGSVALVVSIISQVDRWLRPTIQLYQEISEDRGRLIRAIKRPL